MIGSLTAWLISGSLIFAALLAMWQVALPLLGVVAVSWLIAQPLCRSTNRNNAKRQHEQQLIARADWQHHQIMCGDEIAGMYGEYLPPKEFLPQPPPKKKYRRGVEKSGMPMPKSENVIISSWGGDVIKEVQQ